MTSAEVATAIAEALRAGGGDTVFGMPGGGNNLDLVGAVEAAGMRFVLTHAETPAAIMAGAYADLTGRPTACLVTRGPGAASAVNGAANALLDRHPVLLVTDAVSSVDYGRIAHQRLDQRALLAPVTKWSATVGTEGAAGTAAHAVTTAMEPPRGCVHLDVDPSAASTPPASPTVRSGPADPDLDRAVSMLRRARRPLVLLGVGARDHVERVRDLVTACGAPALATYRAKGVVPDSWPSAAGTFTGGTSEAPLIEASDLLVMIGVDSVELIPNPWTYTVPVLSIAAWPETSPYAAVDLELVGPVDELMGLCVRHLRAAGWEPDAGNRHRDSELARLLAAGPAPADGLSPQDVVRRVRRASPAGTTATVDAGAHMLPSMSLWSTEAPEEVLISSGLATMGYALPASIGAALARPGHRVVVLTGDGGLGMCVGELETLSRHRLPVTVVVFNDARLSLIAIKARPEGHGGEGAVSYTPTDFARVAQGYGLLGVAADSPERLDAALATALTHEGPSLVDVRVNPSAYPAILDVIRGPRSADELLPPLSAGHRAGS